MKQDDKLPRREKLVQMETGIALVLRYGVILCGVVIGIGLSFRLLQLGQVSINSKDFVATLLEGKIIPSYTVPRTISSLFQGILHFQTDSIIALGLLLLIFLPIVRVGLTVLLFLAECDFVYFFITLFVLAVLLSSLSLGTVG